MTAPISLWIDGKEIQASSGQTILEVCRKNNVDLPTLCHFDGLSEVGACRMCLVEVEGVSRLLPACVTMIAANQRIWTQTDKLQKYRRGIVELLFSERNHICSVCVADQHCELQELAKKTGMDHVSVAYLMPGVELDASHGQYILDQNRCVLCTRCVRVCDEVEGAHVWDVMNRGVSTRIISGFHEPWGTNMDCTNCGKCVMVCPVGAIWAKGDYQGRMVKHPEKISKLIQKRGG
jgi:bidirectional [NiFe] hydrogenase diaphorase subunit